MDYIIIAIIVFIIRVIPVLKNDRIDFDTYGHLYYASAIKAQKKNPWDSIKIQCYEGENFSHPFLVHWIIGRINKEIILKYQNLINPALDTLFVIFIYHASLIYFKENKKIGILCVLLYTFTPMWFSKISMGPRVHNFTPRLITEIAFPVLIFIALYKTGTESIVHNILYQVIIIMVILNSTKFGVQVIIFMIPVIAVVSNKLELIIFGFMAVCLTIGISKGKFYNQIRRQIQHLIQYYYSNKNNQTSTRDRNRFIKIDVKKLNSKDEIRKLIYCYLFNNSYTAVIFKMPIIILGIINLAEAIYTSRVGLSIGNEILLSALIIYFLINQRKFLFLGEAERYLNHVSLVIIIEAIVYSKSVGSLLAIYIIILYGLIFWVFENTYFLKITNSTIRSMADKEIEDILNKITDQKIVCSTSYHNFSVYRIMLSTGHKAIFPYHMEGEKSKKFIEKYQKNYPFININNIKDMCDEAKCDVIIIDKISSDRTEIITLKLEEVGWTKQKLKNEVYELYLR